MSGFALLAALVCAAIAALASLALYLLLPGSWITLSLLAWLILLLVWIRLLRRRARA